MPNYKKLYNALFNEIEDLINSNNILSKGDLLKLQKRAEDRFLNDEETKITSIDIIKNDTKES